MWFGQPRILSATVALVAALAWLTGTQHCLLGLMREPQSSAFSICHCSQPSSDTGACNEIPSRMLACCQGLLSPNCELASAKVKYSPILLGFQLLAVGHLLLAQPPERILLGTEYDTGPPVGNRFVDTILKRSLRENAPPLIA